MEHCELHLTAANVDLPDESLDRTDKAVASGVNVRYGDGRYERETRRWSRRRDAMTVHVGDGRASAQERSGR